MRHENALKERQEEIDRAFMDSLIEEQKRADEFILK